MSEVERMEEHRECVESARQLASAWRAIARDYARTHTDRTTYVRDVPGAIFRWADSDFAFWNCLAWTEPGIEREWSREKLAQAAAYMKCRRRAGFLWIFEELLSSPARRALAEDANAAGLQHGLTMYGMVADLAALPKPTHRHLSFVRVDSEELLTAYADINSRAYGLSLAAGREGFQDSELWKSGFRAYLALANGIPVSAAATVANDGRLFLAMVATLPPMQRRGYAEATVRHALYEGVRATGLTRATLHATLPGAPLYERIGYRKVCTIQACTVLR